MWCPSFKNKFHKIHVGFYIIPVVFVNNSSLPTKQILCNLVAITILRRSLA